MATIEVALISPDDPTEPGAVYVAAGTDTWRKVGTDTTTTRAALTARGVQFRDIQAPPWRRRPQFAVGDIKRSGATVIVKMNEAGWVAVARAPNGPRFYTDAEVASGTWADGGSIFDREIGDTL